MNFNTRKIAARAFIDRINSVTKCAQCGRQPIEWHNPTHSQDRGKFRIGDMVRDGRAIPEIWAEMDACTPLCRSCHLTKHLHLRQRQLVKCQECPTVSPRLCKGLCPTCYSRVHMQPKKTAYMRLYRQRLKEKTQ